MLEKWLKTLEDKEKALLTESKGLNLDEITLQSVQREIAVNAASVKNYLTSLHNEGYTVGDNLEEIREIYDKVKDDNYRHITNHIKSHLLKMRRVVEQVKKGKFNPEFADNY